jgi:hypothetical protein
MAEVPLISVILPSYNHARFVTAAVRSVLDQTVQDLELIVVDDGSNDDTPDLVESIHDPRLQLIRLGQNRLQHPRNTGLSLARAQYIAFQNSDDVWHPQKLEKQLKVMQERKDVAACFTEVEIIDEDGHATFNSWAAGSFTNKNHSNLEWLKYFFEDGNFLCISSAMIRRKPLEQVGNFRGSLVQLSDLDLWIRLAALGQIYIVNEKLISFRDTHGNLSGPNASAQNRLTIEFASILKNYTTPPIVDLLPQIFPHAIPMQPNTKNIRLAYLAKYAWSLQTVFHSLFADDIISCIMDDEASRKEVTEVFGTEIIQEFIKRRGLLSIHFTEGSVSSNSLFEIILQKIKRRIARLIRY